MKKPDKRLLNLENHDIQKKRRRVQTVSNTLITSNQRQHTGIKTRDQIQTLRLATGLAKLNKQETNEFLIIRNASIRDSAISAMTQAEGVELMIRPPQSSARHLGAQTSSASASPEIASARVWNVPPWVPCLL
jgi:hypothetical protein